MSAIDGSTASRGYSRRSRAAVWLRNVALTSMGTYSSAVPAARIASRMTRLFSALPAPSSMSAREPSRRMSEGIHASSSARSVRVG